MEDSFIELIDSSSIEDGHFFVSVTLRETLQNEIRELSKADIIEKSNNRYPFPLIVDKKKTERKFIFALTIVNWMKLQFLPIIN